MDPARGHVLGIAVVRTDARGNVRTVGEGVKAAYSERIESDGESDPEARDFEDAIQAMRALVMGPSFDPQFIVVSHGAALDREFLRRAWQRCGNDGEIFGERRAWLDMNQIVWPLAYCDMVSSRDLASVASVFGLTNTAPDTCTGDCELLVRTYWAMMRRYRLAMVGEQTAREAIGETLGGALGKLGSLIGV